MKSIIYLFLILLLISGCSSEPKAPKEVENISVQNSDTIVEKEVETKKDIVLELLVCNELNVTKIKVPQAKIIFDDLPNTHLLKSDFDKLPDWSKEDYTSALESFINSCRTKNTKKIYRDLCRRAPDSKSAKYFLQKEFIPYEINTKNGEEEGLLTGYYEPQLRGSLVKTRKYKYPIYETPQDLIIVDLSSIYPKLKNYRLRGRVKGNRLVPYYTRKETKSKHIKANVICYTDSKIDRFFLEVQGSGRVILRDGKTIFLGYDNQNGHRYNSIGKYLIKIKAIKLKEISLQSIKAWLIKHPKRMDEVLNYNKSVVYFKKKEGPASGSLGVCLTPKRSIAVDKRYIPLGSVLYLSADIKDKNVSKIVVAQDTGGAIKGAIRADIFLGFGEDAADIAGGLKSPLKLWILLPKDKEAM